MNDRICNSLIFGIAAILLSPLYLPMLVWVLPIIFSPSFILVIGAILAIAIPARIMETR